MTDISKEVAQTEKLIEALRLTLTLKGPGVLRIASGAVKGSLEIQSGKINAAEIPSTGEMGPTALEKLLRLTDGAFQYVEPELVICQHDQRFVVSIEGLLSKNLAFKASDAVKIEDDAAGAESTVEVTESEPGLMDKLERDASLAHNAAMKKMMDPNAEPILKIVMPVVKHVPQPEASESDDAFSAMLFGDESDIPKTLEHVDAAVEATALAASEAASAAVESTPPSRSEPEVAAAATAPSEVALESIGAADSEWVVDSIPKVSYRPTVEDVGESVSELSSESSVEAVSEAFPEVTAGMDVEVVSATVPELIAGTDVEVVSATVPELIAGTDVEVVSATVPILTLGTTVEAQANSPVACSAPVEIEQAQPISASSIVVPKMPSIPIPTETWEPVEAALSEAASEESGDHSAPAVAQAVAPAVAPVPAQAPAQVSVVSAPYPPNVPANAALHVSVSAIQEPTSQLVQSVPPIPPLPPVPSAPSAPSVSERLNNVEQSAPASVSTDSVRTYSRRTLSAEDRTTTSGIYGAPSAQYQTDNEPEKKTAFPLSPTAVIAVVALVVLVVAAAVLPGCLRSMTPTQVSASEARGLTHQVIDDVIAKQLPRANWNDVGVSGR